MLKKIVFSQKIRKIRREFNGKTQTIRGNLIAELNELYQWAIKRTKAVRNEKHKQKWSRIAAYIAKCINVIMRDYDANKISEKLDELRRLVENELLKDKTTRNRNTRKND